jgi:hypothetical protein
VDSTVASVTGEMENDFDLFLIAAVLFCRVLEQNISRHTTVLVSNSVQNNLNSSTCLSPVFIKLRVDHLWEVVVSIPDEVLHFSVDLILPTAL